MPQSREKVPAGQRQRDPEAASGGTGGGARSEPRAWHLPTTKWEIPELFTRLLP